MSDLDSVLVVSLEHAVAAPYASCMLADAGARVIKVERPEGDFARDYDSLANGLSAYFVWLNRGKQSICLDLKDKEDVALMRSILGKADVFLQNLAPGTIEKFGLGIDDLRAGNPGLIACSISGYGSSGPASGQKAYDLLVQAESGLSAINGTEEVPARVGISVCDIAAGMTAYQSILRALIGRQKTGRGRAIEISLFHVMSDWMNVPYLQYRYGGVKPVRMGLHHPSIAPYGVFACRDGAKILLAIQNQREWARLCTDVLGDPGLATATGFATNSERVKNRQAVDAKISEVTAKLDRNDVLHLLKDAGIAYGRLSEPDDLIAHPQHRLISVQTENGLIELLAPGAVIADAPQNFGPVPMKDADGARIRAEFTAQAAKQDKN